MRCRLCTVYRDSSTVVVRYLDDILVSFEVFNLFDYKNVVSYIWITDYSNTPYHVPNYLTARQFNLKLTVTF